MCNFQNTTFDNSLDGVVLIIWTFTSRYKFIYDDACVFNMFDYFFNQKTFFIKDRQNLQYVLNFVSSLNWCPSEAPVPNFQILKLKLFRTYSPYLQSAGKIKS